MPNSTVRKPLRRIEPERIVDPLGSHKVLDAGINQHKLVIARLRRQLVEKRVPKEKLKEELGKIELYRNTHASLKALEARRKRLLRNV